MTSSTASHEPVTIEREGALVSLRLNRPYANNALDRAMRDALMRLLGELALDIGVHAIVLKGAGEEAFSIGLDLPEMSLLTPIEAEATALSFRALYERLATMPVPVIAAIKGACIGSGLELALHCDMRIARGDARFGFPGINIGLTPGGAGIERLTRLIGAGPAHALFLTGGVVSAERAFMLGLITNVIAPKDFEQAVGEFGTHLSELPSTATRELKAMLIASLKGGVSAKQGAEAFAKCFGSGEAAARMRAAIGGPGPDVVVH